MRLPPQDTERFYRIWFALLHYINTQLHLVPSFPAAPGEQDVSPEVTMQVRDALWAHDALREQFLAENPAQLPAADLVQATAYACHRETRREAVGRAHSMARICGRLY